MYTIFKGIFIALTVRFVCCYEGSEEAVELVFHHKFTNPIDRLTASILKSLDTSKQNITQSFKEGSDLFLDVQNKIQNFEFSSYEYNWITNLCEPMWKNGSYTRIQLAHIPGTMTLLQLCWDKGAVSPIHSHGGHLGGESQCFIRVLTNSLTEKIYRNSVVNSTYDGPLELMSTRHATAGQVTYMNDDIGLHEISTPEKTISLHFYIPGYKYCYAICQAQASQESNIQISTAAMKVQAIWKEEVGGMVII